MLDVGGKEKLSNGKKVKQELRSRKLVCMEPSLTWVQGSRALPAKWLLVNNALLLIHSCN